MPAALAACATIPREPSTQEAATMAAADAGKAPFMFKEAALPTGFPPVGPLGQIVVKEYPAYRAAVVNAADRPGGPNSMFSPLFNHIKKNDIAMSTPVEIVYAESATQPRAEAPPPESMAFVYGAPALGRPGRDGLVTVQDYPAATYVSLAVRGSYTDERFHVAAAQVFAWVEAHAAEYEVAGKPRYLAYNSPFVPWFLKLGEVQVPVRRIAEPIR